MLWNKRTEAQTFFGNNRHCFETNATAITGNNATQTNLRYVRLVLAPPTFERVRAQVRYSDQAT